jgi:hypothetical protein
MAIGDSMAPCSASWSRELGSAVGPGVTWPVLVAVGVALRVLVAVGVPVGVAVPVAAAPSVLDGVGVGVVVCTALDVGVGVGVAVRVGVGLEGTVVRVGVVTGIAPGYSSAPMSGAAIPSPSPSMGRGSPSKSWDEAPSRVPASIRAEPASR